MSAFRKLVVCTRQARLLQLFRNFHGNPVLRNQNMGASAHKVNNLEKKFLVWTKKYKTVEDVPKYVP